MIHKKINIKKIKKATEPTPVAKIKTSLNLIIKSLTTSN